MTKKEQPQAGKKPKNILIMGAAGRDFHNFNMVYRDDPNSRVVAFTAAQIPDIAGRRYPPALAGPLYPDGIPIVDEADLDEMCREQAVDQVVFAYSDVSHAQVMQKACIALATGADFLLLGPRRTMLQAKVSVIAICAVRTGCGKSQTTRWLAALLKDHGLHVAVIRHPMPYGDLERQAVQRFATRADLDAANCTIEEREEYEPHLALGTIVYAGVDYAQIMAQAEQEADIILWDGGNNDFSFLRPDLQIVLVDPLRPGNETSHYPGEAVLRMADIVVLAKANSAADADIQSVTENTRRINPTATLVRAASPVTLDDPERVRGKRVLVVEDGPTLTHGEMPFGAGVIAARRCGAASMADPRPYLQGSLADTFAAYPHIGTLLPAMGYGDRQIRDLEATINGCPCDLVLSATPIDLTAVLEANKPVVRVRYAYQDNSTPTLETVIRERLKDRL